jgi:hypothetical protein
MSQGELNLSQIALYVLTVFDPLLAFFLLQKADIMPKDYSTGSSNL